MTTFIEIKSQLDKLIEELDERGLDNTINYLREQQEATLICKASPIYGAKFEPTAGVAYGIPFGGSFDPDDEKQFPHEVEIEKLPEADIKLAAKIYRQMFPDVSMQGIFRRLKGKFVFTLENHAQLEEFQEKLKDIATITVIKILTPYEP